MEFASKWSFNQTLGGQLCILPTHEFSSQNSFSLHTFIEFRHTISTLNVLQMHSQTTTTKTHHKVEYKNPKHVIINSKKHKIPINPKIISINLKHVKFECLIIHTPLLAPLEQCFRMFWSKGWMSTWISYSLPYLTLRKKLKPSMVGWNFKRKTQENEFLVKKKKKECGWNLKKTSNLEKNEGGR